MDDSLYLYDSIGDNSIVAGFTLKDYKGTDLEKEIPQLASDLGIVLKDAVYLNQVHEDTVIVFDGTNGVELDQSIIHSFAGDAIVTARKGTLIIVRTADCIPICLYDNQNHVSALVHAGWRSANMNILSKTIDSMKRDFMSQTEDIIMVLGPGLQKNSFEVQEDFFDNFNLCPYIEKIDTKLCLDLSMFLQDEAISNGILEHNIVNSGICSYENNDLLYSYRRGDKENRTISFMFMR